MLTISKSLLLERSNSELRSDSNQIRTSERDGGDFKLENVDFTEGFKVATASAGQKIL